jgi:hypothetical protein
MKHWRDRTGELKKYADYWLDKGEFEHLTKFEMRILFCFRETNSFDDDGYPVIAKAAKVPPRERDLYGFDFRLTWAHNLWTEMGRKQRLRYMWHELNHLQVETDEDGHMVEDRDGRVSTFISRHDIVIRRFEAEIDRFGLGGDEVLIAAYLAKKLREYKKRRA